MGLLDRFTPLLRFIAENRQHSAHVDVDRELTGNKENGRLSWPLLVSQAQTLLPLLNHNGAVE